LDCVKVDSFAGVVHVDTDKRSDDAGWGLYSQTYRISELVD
jgi:hypothetical protein